MRQKKYLLKQSSCEDIKKAYKLVYFVQELGFSKSYMSLVFSRKKSVSKSSAYAITKCINANANILDFFVEE